LEQIENIDAQNESRLSDAETVAKSFPQVHWYCFLTQSTGALYFWNLLVCENWSLVSLQCSVSLSIICPKQLPKLRSIYNAVRMRLLCGLFSFVLMLAKAHLWHCCFSHGGKITKIIWGMGFGIPFHSILCSSEIGGIH
jgi:hypothetical protein